MFVEESIVDAKAKTFVIYKRNVTQAKLLSMIEKSTYCVSPTNPKLYVNNRYKTLCRHVVL